MEFRILSLICIFTTCGKTLSTERTTSFSTTDESVTQNTKSFDKNDLFCSPGDLTCPSGFCCTGFLCFPEHLKKVHSMECIPNSDGNMHDFCGQGQMGIFLFDHFWAWALHFLKTHGQKWARIANTLGPYVLEILQDNFQAWEE